MDKDKGGLGIRRSCLLNKALLCQWSWRFTAENNSLWKSVTNIKYGVEKGGWVTCISRGSYSVVLWKDIRKETILLAGYSTFAIEDGRRMSFFGR